MPDDVNAEGVTPTLYCPFESATSEFADKVQHGSLEWCRRYRLFDTRNENSFATARFADLAARTFPTATRATLQLIADWTSWLFAFDDLIDCGEEGRDPHVVQGHADRFVAILAGEDRTRESPSALSLSLAELRERMARASSPAWMNRFTHSALEYFEGCVWEAGNRAHSTIPSVRTYQIMRRFAGAVHTYLDFVELAGGFYLSAELRKDPRLQRLAMATNNVACWTNDIYSAPRERHNGDMHNLVLLQMSEGGLSYPEAFTRTISACDAEVRRFIAIEKELLASKTHSAIVSYCAAQRAIMRGNLDWCLATSRYNEPS